MSAPLKKGRYYEQLFKRRAMNNKFLGLIGLALFMSTGLVQAVTSEIRSPLSILRGPYHYPLGPVEDSIWSMKKDKSPEKDNLWLVDWWATGYKRSADRAYIDCCNSCCDCSWNECCPNECTDCCSQTTCDGSCGCNKSSTTTKQVPLAMLFFGKADFRGEEAFEGGLLVEAGGTPALRFATLSPRFDYNEQGAVLGLHAQRKFNDESKWHFGGRAMLPIKVIDVEQRQELWV